MLAHIARASLIALLALTLAAPSVSAKGPPSRDQQRDSIVTLLAAKNVRLNRRVLDTVGPDVNELLIDIAGHPRETEIVRAHAVAALSVYPSGRTRAYLRGLLHERTLIGTRFGNRVRAQAVRSLALAFGDEAIDDVVPLRSDTDPQIREAVARALGDTRSHYAMPILTTWLSQENVLHVRVAIDDAILRIGQR